ncbi:GPP34 family phosphoprotein [Streptomyces sp. HPF1205]|uniref:GOLPH3/VPS74 family protein n=1 Tax=Streptomyces sp. HPF1205 TaxID=2873262 RepID=UPI001CEC0901|nr:GPP34 family phosphoprotein [Streptomyces sp. HPF1205]
MTTAHDLMILALEPSGRPVDQGDLSLALAGAEAIDLLGAGVIVLDGARILPETSGPAGDRLLTEASHQVRRAEPYEDVTDWLWRRGRGLADAYLAELESLGEVRQEERRRWVVFKAGEPVLADTAARRQAAARRDAGEPVLGALAAAVGLVPGPAGEGAGEAEAQEQAETEAQAEDPAAWAVTGGSAGAAAEAALDEAYAPAPGAQDVPVVADRWAATVLDRLADALAELAAERDRRAHKLDDATADNYRRGY